MINTKSAVKTGGFYRSLFLGLLLLVTGNTYQASAQDPAMCTTSSIILVGGTDFSCTYEYGVGQTMHEIENTALYGPSGPILLSSMREATTNAQVGTAGYYALVKNPGNVGKGYPDINQSMLILPVTSNNPQLYEFLNFNVPGLRPGSPIKVVIEGYYLTSGTCAPILNCAFNKMYNGTTNPSLDARLSPATPVAGTKFTTTVSGTLSAADPTGNLILRMPYNPALCVALGITKLEVWGCPNIEVVSLESSEMCTGEQTRLFLDRKYATSNLKWEKSTTSGTAGFTEIPNSAGKENVLQEITQDTWFKCTVNGLLSKVLKINTMTCCVNDQGIPTSRKVVYLENFGVFNGPRDYVDRNGVPQPDLVTSDYCARLPNLPGLTTGVQGHTYACPVTNMGHYSVSTFTKLAPTYMKGCARGDAGNSMAGGILSVDVANGMTGVIYERLIEGLCSDKTIYFQIAFCPGAQGSTASDIAATITKTDGTTMNNRTIITEKRQRGGFLSAWNIIKTDPFILPAGETSVYLQLRSYGTGWQNNQDHLYDDIKFMVCSPPNIELYSDLATLKLDTTVCGVTTLEIATKVSELVNKTYGGKENVRYLYQWSSDNIKWNNIGVGAEAIRTDSFLIVSSADYDYPKTYFRLAVAREDALGAYLIDPNYESFEDNCRNTSVSKSFVLSKGETLNGMEDATIPACKGDKVVLSGAIDPKIVSWGWTDGAGGVLVPQSTLAANRNYTYTFNVAGSSDVVYYVGYSAKCVARKKFTITEKNKVTFNLSQQQDCGKTTITANSTPSSGVTYTWGYSNGSAIATTTSPLVLNSPAYSDGTVTVTGKATGYCDSDPVTQVVTIKTIPLKPTVANLVVSYQKEPGSVDISTNVNAQTTAAGNTLFWRNASGVLVNPPMQDKSVEGTFYFWVGQVTPQGCRDSIQITVIISEVPTPEVHETSVCQNKQVGNLSVLVEPNPDPAIYELVWYATLGSTGSTTPIDPSTINTGTPGEQYVYVTYREILDHAKESGKVPIKITVIVQPTVTSIDYAGKPFCTSAGVKPVTLNGSPGGSYSSTAGLTVDSSNGNITPGAAGVYTVTYTIAATNGCSDASGFTTVTITQLPSVEISYPGTPFCKSDANAKSVSFANGKGAYTGGSYSSTEGLTISSGNGDITPSSSTPGTYTVIYTIPASGGCSEETATTTVTITLLPEATISYSQTSFCTSDEAKSVILTGTQGGTYSVSPVGLTINGGNGDITPGSSTPGSYTVTYTIQAAAGCGEVTAQTDVAITQAPSATISYAKAAFCISAEVQEVDLDGTGAYTGGNYVAIPGGLTIHPSTGAITPGSSQTGTYTVTYNIPPFAGCEPAKAITQVTIDPLPTAKISTAEKSICPDEILTISGAVTNGILSWSSNGGGSFSDPAAATTTYSPSVSDAGNTVTLTLTATSNNACAPAEIATDTYQLPVIPFPEKPIVNGEVIYYRSDIQADNTFKNLLLQKPGVVAPSAGATLYWSEDNGLTWSAALPVPPTPAPDDYNDKSYDYLVKQQRNAEPPCKSLPATVTARIYLIQTPEVSPVKYCINATAVPLTAVINPATGYTKDNYTLKWYDKDGNFIMESPAGVENAGPVPSTTDAGMVIYQVSQHNGNIESGRVPLEVIVYDVKTPDVKGNKLRYCAYDSPQELVVNSVEDAPYYLADGFEWSVNGSVQSSKPVVNTEVNANTTYKYGVKQTYKISETKICKGPEAPININITEKLTLELSATPEKIQIGNEVTLTVTASTDNHLEYEWYNNNSLYKKTGQSENVLIAVLEGGTHLFQVKTFNNDNNECFAESNIKQIEVADYTEVPNIILPDKGFMLPKGNLPGYKVEIYNRYMQKVYEGDNGWNGTYRGKPAEPGTYFYRIFMKDGKIEKGTLEVAKF
jgi:gliding motility-associated-like protein